MRKCLFLLTCIALLLPALTHGVGTSFWTQTSEAEFKTGKLENVVVTNLGDLKLSRAVKTLLAQDADISSVNALAEAPDGTVYAGTGPSGVLLRIKDDKVSKVATIANAVDILSILIDKNGAIYLGTSGESGRILKIAKPGDEPQVIFQADGVQYVWAMARTPDGNLYAATGPSGQLMEIKPDGSKRALLETSESNLVSLISDGKDLLYAGTDPHGLVYRVNRKTGESFVLYNAVESEISALALDKEGNLYAATSEARVEAAPAPAEATERAGRPEGAGVGVPIPADRPKEPTPPAPPNPNPGQPSPIPKTPPAPPQTRSHGHFPTLQAAWALAARVASDDTAAQVPWALVAQVTSDAPDDSQKKRRPKPGPGNPNPVPPNPGKPDPVPAPTTQKATPLPPATTPAVDTTANAEPRAEGNAIYKIDPDGFVTEIFRQAVLINSMVENNGTLIIATGGTEGQVYQLRPKAEETLVLAKVDARQTLCLLPTRDGKILMGTANVGSLASMSSGYASKGTFTSQVLDATQISRFGKIHLHGSLPTGTSLTVATRSGNVTEADEKTWSKWSDETPAAEFMPVMSPSARFLQYRVTFASPEGKETPVVRDVSIAYQVPNLPPVVKTVKVSNSLASAVDSLSDPDSAARKVESSRRQAIAWEASDPNGDTLTFSIYLRPVGEPGWILLKEKLTESTYEWDTRTTADGRYEVKVMASDAASNPPGKGKTASRVSDPVTVDNTPPVIGDVKSQQRGGDMHITLKVVDRTSTVAAVDYSVDSSKDWQFVLPTDQIYDSPEETVSFSIPGLKPGQHQVTLRATDSKGNQSFENLFITVQSPAAMGK
jgi:hypothetical protein